MGTPWQKIFCISLCLVALGQPAFSGQTASFDEPKPAKKQAADDASPAVEFDQGPTLPGPVVSDDSKSKVTTDAQPLKSDESELSSTQASSKTADQAAIQFEESQLENNVPLIADDILLAPEAYSPKCNHGGRCKKQCKQCRQCACFRCGCNHDTYLLIDFLFFKRNNATNNATLAESANAPVLTTRSTNPGTAPGIRLFGGRLRENGVGWEFGYTGVFGMFGERTVRAQPTLKIPGPLPAQAGWDNLDAIRSSYTSSLNMCEINLFTSQVTTKGGPRSPFPWHRVHGTFEHEFQWLGGFRWAGFNDVASLYPDASVVIGNNDGTYSITTNSQMLGPQIGFKTKRRWNNWSMEGWTKATLAGTFLNADSAPIITQASPVAYRPQASARDVGVGFIGDMNYSIVRRLNRRWSLRAGYNLIWISGVALAPNQFDFSLNQSITLAGAGNVFLHGANLGLEAQW